MRERGARAVQAVFDAFGFPPITDEEVRLATTCLDSRDLPDRDRAADVVAGDRVLAEGIERARRRARARRARLRRRRRRRLRDAAPAGRRRLPPDLGDHRADGTVVSAVNDPNDYTGPGTGYRLEGERWERLQRLPHAIDARLLGAAPGPRAPVEEIGPAAARRAAGRGRDRGRPRLRRRARPRRSTASPTRTCSRRSSTGVARARAARRALVRITRSADVAFIGHDGAQPLRLRHRRRPPVEGHGADPPRRPRAARQPRALRDGAVADARVVPPDRRATPPATRSAGRSRPCRRCWTTTRARS